MPRITIEADRRERKMRLIKIDFENKREQFNESFTK